MAVKTFTTGEVLTASDTNTYLNNGGLVFIKSQTIGPGVTSVSVSNAFSTTYDDYRIVVSGTLINVAGSSLFITFSGSSGATSYWAGNYQAYSSGTSTSIGAAGGSSGLWLGISGGYTSTCHDVTNPFKAQPTNISGSYSTNTWTGVTGGQDNNAVSHTGFSVVQVGSPTMTGGTITVYGYRKA